MDDAEAAAAAEAIHRSALTGAGPYGRDAESALGRLLDGARPLLMNSCTSALEAAVTLAGVGPGDEVVLPSFTFVSCANAVVRAGARPVFADIDRETLNIDPAAIAAAITPRTRAVIVVHYAGRACDMTRILEITRHAKVVVIEDAAHALGATWNGRSLGTIGDYGCFSFHGTKDVVCGEGGALICSREEDRDRAEMLREKGTNRDSFLRGDVAKYSWVAEGSSYVLSDVLAAILLVQLSRLPAILARKRALARALSAALSRIADRVILPREWPGIESSWHLYPILVPAGSRDQVIAALGAEKITAAFHYVPLHESPYARRRFGTTTGMLPVTEMVGASLVRLPLFAAMSDDDLADVADATVRVIEAVVPSDSGRAILPPAR
jgi:dTDP-4-amino-4,6-dideoxygalactose transaminase